jgi:hypothetical protein
MKSMTLLSKQMKHVGSIDFVEANGANDIVVEAAKSMTLLKQTMSMMFLLKQMKMNVVVKADVAYTDIVDKTVYVNNVFVESDSVNAIIGEAKGVD